MEAQTSRKHLEEKVEDLIRQLKGNEEKLAVYERRPGVANSSQPIEQDLSLEQQLEAEVAELRYVLFKIFVRSFIVPIDLPWKSRKLIEVPQSLTRINSKRSVKRVKRR